MYVCLDMSWKQLLLFLMITSLSVGSVQAQKGKRLKSYSERSQEDQSLLDQAKALKKSNPTEATKILQRVLEIAIPEKHYGIEAEALYVLGEIYFDAEQFEISGDYFNRSLNIFRREYDSNGAYRATKFLAHSKQKNKEYEAALELYESFLKMSKQKGNVKDQLFVHQERASIYTELNEAKLALMELDFADSLSRLNLLNDKEKARIYLKRGEVYEAQAEEEAALEEYEKSEQLSLSIQDKEFAAESNYRQGNLLNKSGKKAEAVSKSKKGLELLEEVREDANVADSLFELEDQESKLNFNIGLSYLEQDSAVKAIDYFKSAIEISSNQGNLLEEKTAYGYLSEAYLATDQNDSALIAYKSYVDLIDTIYKRKERQIQASLTLNEELVQSMVKINSLEKDREIQEKTIELLRNRQLAEEQSNRQLKYVVIGLLLFLILLIILIYFMNKNSKQKRINNQLLALKNLRTQMNPHFIFNALNSVNNFISQSDERSANRYLSDFSSLMRLVLENSDHDFILLNKEVEILKLYVGLEHSRFSDKFDYQLNLSDGLDLEQYRIPPMLIQPYIENSVWHGLRYLDQKGELLIEITEESDNLIIIIEDNGIGRQHSQRIKTKNQKKNRSTAMKNIEERLAIINELHKFKIEVNIQDVSADGSGTRVEITIPKRSK